MAPFYLFILTILTNSYQKTFKIDRHGLVNMSFQQLNDSLRKTMTTDVNYEKLLYAYVEKAKIEKNTEELFEGYYRTIYSQKSTNEMHHYADSLLTVSKQLVPIFYIRALQAKANCYYVEKKYKKSLEFELLALGLINKSKDAYVYNKSLYGVGQIYFHIQEYVKAFESYHQARLYFEKSTEYNHLQGFCNAIYREAFSLYYLGKYQESRKLIEGGLSKITMLKPDDIPFKEAYFKYILGLNEFQQASHTISTNLLNEALPQIVENEDFANEAIIYYYLGLNYWKLNEKPLALEYFKKVDRIFSKHQYSNLEIKDAFLYLIEYYKNENDAKSVLRYTNQLLTVTVHLQKEYQFLTKLLHTKLDIKSLQSDKEGLEIDLNRRNSLIKILLICGIFITISFPILLWYHAKTKRKEVRLRTLHHKQLRDSKLYKKYLITDNIQISTISNEQPWLIRANNELKTSTFDINDKVVKNILNHLEDFERKKDFLKKDLNLNDLAQHWNTNRSYLSQCINLYKGKSFVDYLNTLRIHYFLDVVNKDHQWCKFKIQFISDTLGFSNSRSFSNAFSKVTGISPHHFIQQINNE